ncbi:helix-turn-helix transcriptional regulator [Paenibacillus sp. GCM10027626]|uniref:helix-turn-helix transcriptional regulator n=1 Tax=Paenibacillus sp. GCM10027626 TaxID=3273411 RepID=UPI003643E474
MTVFQMSAPPLPYFLACGEAVYEIGGMHPARRAIGVFDLLLVTEGCLFMGEEGTTWEVGSGQALLLRPDAYHYSAAGCSTRTHFYWLHFVADGPWGEWENEQTGMNVAGRCGPTAYDPFAIVIPRHAQLYRPAKTYEEMRKLLALNHQSGSRARWRQQTIVQDVMQSLEPIQASEKGRHVSLVADKAATFLRKHYKENIDSKRLAEVLNYHYVYISRCMKQKYGGPPLDYLTRYRVEQAKLLLVNSDLSIARVAEEVGFQNVSYFCKRFMETEGVTPRVYRQRFHVLE